MTTKPADEMTDDDLAEAVETLASFARKFLPEGYVLRLDCSQHADGIQLIWCEESDLAGLQPGYPGSPCESVPLEGKEGWGYACDAANDDYPKRVLAAEERGEL